MSMYLQKYAVPVMWWPMPVTSGLVRVHRPVWKMGMLTARVEQISLQRMSSSQRASALPASVELAVS